MPTRRRGRGEGDSRARLGARRGRSAPRPRVGRGLEPALAAGGRDRDGRSQGGHARPPRERCADPGHEHRPQARLRDPGGAARPRDACAHARPGDLGRDRRRPHPHRFRPLLPGPDHLWRRDRHPGGLRRDGAGTDRHAPGQGCRGSRSRRRRSRATRDSTASRRASSPPRTQASWRQPRSSRAAASRRWFSGDSVTGESREVAKVHAAIARQLRLHSHPYPAACGRHLRGRDHRHAAWNRQGRAVQRVPALARRRLGGLERTWALAADTDGIDGAESQRGGDRGGPIRSRARAALGLDARRCSRTMTDSGSSGRWGDLVVTGPHAHQRERLPGRARPVAAEARKSRPAFGFPLGRPALQAAFSSLADSSLGSGRSISSTSAIGALSPTRKPHLRMRR